MRRKSLATQSAPAGTTIHPEGEPQDIITRPPLHRQRGDHRPAPAEIRERCQDAID
ncbi:MAG: hypothetical protein H6633_35795 [Anaerolineales bacterium]|nr:hypothetical protein [Anaerolineales bacterium]